MKEATGELNMTVIVIVAIVAVGTLFSIFVYPMIKNGIAAQTCKTYGPNYQVVTVGGKSCCQQGSEQPICPTTDETTTK